MLRENFVEGDLTVFLQMLVHYTTHTGRQDSHYVVTSASNKLVNHLVNKSLRGPDEINGATDEWSDRSRHHLQVIPAVSSSRS